MMKPYTLTIVVAVALLVVIAVLTYMYVTARVSLNYVNDRYISLLNSVTELQLIRNVHGSLPVINVSAVYATMDGYAIVLTISNPENYTQYLYYVDVTSLPYSLRTYYVGNVAIPPLSRITYPIFVYVNSSALTVSTIYNFNQVAGGSESTRITAIGPVYYSLSTLPGSTMTLSYSLINGSTITYPYVIMNFTVLNNTIYASAVTSDSWPSEVLLSYLSPRPFTITGYKLIAPNGTVMLSCTSTSASTYPNGTIVSYIPTPVGQVYLPLYNASAVTTIHYWLGSYWDTFTYNVTSTCLGSFILFSKPSIHYELQVNYSINGEEKTLTIPVTFYTTSILAWS